MEQRVVGFIERLRRLAVGGPLMILVALVLSSCGTQQQARATTLRMMVGAEPPHLNRIVLTSATIDPVVLNVMEPLVDLDKQGQPVGKLATKWEPSADLSRWRFTLRQGVKFQNGDTFSAHDVVDTVKWVIDESKASFVYSRLPMKDAVAVDDHTVDIIFDKGQPLFLINIPYLLIYPSSVAKDNRSFVQTSAIGTGPYKFVDWQRGVQVDLTRFDGYWGTKPQIQNVQIIFRAEADVRLAALRNKEADWVYGLSPEQASQAPKTVQMPSQDTVFIRFDELIAQNPLFADKRLRLAVDYAIDRQALVSLFGGTVTPSLGQFASPGEFGYNPNLKAREYDPAKAKALVEEAGAVGKTITFAGYAGRWAKDREASEAVAKMIEATGLKVKLMLLPFAEAEKFKVTTGKDPSHISDIFFSPSDALLEVESRGQKMFVVDQVHYALNDVHPTEMYKDELAETNRAKREEKLRNIWAYVYEEAHYVPLIKLNWIWGVAPNLEWEPDLAGRPIVADMHYSS